MSLVEGIGDEVMMVVVLFLLMVVFLVAWLSTSVNERNFVNVLILETRHRLLHQAPAAQTQQQQQQQQQSEGGVQHDLYHPDPGEDQAATRGTEHVVSQHSDTSETAPSATVSPNSNDNTVSSEDTAPVLDHSPNITTNSNNCNYGNNMGSNSGNNEQNVPGGVIVEDSGAPAVNTIPETLNELRKRRLEALTRTPASESIDHHVTQNSSSNLEQSEISSSRQQPESTTEQPGQSVSSSHQFHGQNDENSQSEELLQSDQSDTPVYDPDNGLIRLRLRFLTEVERLVQGRIHDTVAQLRSREFAAELAENKIVRFIFNGRELRPDTDTLQTFNIVDSSVIHCLIAQGGQGQMPSQGEGRQQEHAVELDMSHMMLPLFGIILAILWYFRIVYKVYFNPMSTVTLVGFTIMYAVALASAFTPRRQEGNVHIHRQPHVHAE